MFSGTPKIFNLALFREVIILRIRRSQRPAVRRERAQALLILQYNVLRNTQNL